MLIQFCMRQFRQKCVAVKVLMAILCATVSAMASPCLEQGMHVFQTSGASAAYPAFRSSLEDPACVQSVVLLLNYGRIIERIVDAEGDGPKTCEAVEVYSRVVAVDDASESIRRLGRIGQEKLSPRCSMYVERQGVEDYERIVARADALRGAGRLRVAALDYATAFRLNSKRREAPLALCEILPRIGRNSEAPRFCINARPIVQAVSPLDGIVEQPVETAQSNSLGWLLGSVAIATAVSGGVVHLIAGARADDAWQARRAAEQAANGGDATALAQQRRALTNERGSAETFEIIAWSLYGSSAVLTGFALYALIAIDDSTTLQVGVAPTGARIFFAW